MQAQQDLCVVGESRTFDYGIDWVRVKVVGPATVASGMARHEHAVLAKTENFSAINQQTEIFAFNFQCSRYLLGDSHHHCRQNTTISAIDNETVLRRANDSLHGYLVDDVAIIDQLEHVKMILINYH